MKEDINGKGKEVLPYSRTLVNKRRRHDGDRKSPSATIMGIIAGNRHWRLKVASESMMRNRKSKSS